MGVDSLTGRAGRISAEISAHYVDNARSLPWRVAPARSARGVRPDPYHVWLSEVMLQQTTVATVRGYFTKFTERWPTIAALAAAPIADILAHWAGLGYYARARNLHKCAVYVTEKLGGNFPETEEELQALPGVGPYTAAAIAAIAFGQRAVVVDANIERLMARLFAISTPLPRAKKEIRARMDSLTPATGAGDFAQACMDIGATICSARRPQCGRCPLQGLCQAAAAGEPENYPVKPPRKEKPLRRGRFFWIERDGDVLLVQRPDKGMLGGMRALPDDEWAAGRHGHRRPPFDAAWQIHNKIVQHSFTHFSLEVDLAVHQMRDDDGPGQDHILQHWADATWWPLDKIDAAGLPTLFAKAVKWKEKEP